MTAPICCYTIRRHPLLHSAQITLDTPLKRVRSPTIQIYKSKSCENYALSRMKNQLRNCILCSCFFRLLSIAFSNEINSGGSKGRQGGTTWGSKFFHFHAVFGKKFAHPLWKLAPPQENPGSATDQCYQLFDV